MERYQQTVKPFANSQMNKKKPSGLTAMDLYINPSLLYSKQFKQLPKEIQFQLTTALKRLQALHRPNQTQGETAKPIEPNYDELMVL